MRQVDEHCEISAAEACQGGQGLSAANVWAFALGLILVAATAFVLIALYAQS
jgi:hypothetical protein